MIMFNKTDNRYSTSTRAKTQSTNGHAAHAAHDEYSLTHPKRRLITDRLEENDLVTFNLVPEISAPWRVCLHLSAASVVEYLAYPKFLPGKV